MKQYKFCWIFFSVLLMSVVACTGLQTKPYSLSSGKTEFMAEYCRSGKQMKAYGISVIYFAPQIEKGIPLDQAAKKQKSNEEKKDQLLKRLFYMLGNSKTNNPYVHHYNWFSLTSDDEKDILANIKEENVSTRGKPYTLIVKSPKKIFIYDSSERYQYSHGYASDLNNLMDEYTILTPKNVIEEITGSKFDYRYLYETIILNERGEIDISMAIEGKDALWRAYIKKFTSIKEVSEDNSEKTTIDLALDLNTFCKYGRKISDLQTF